MAFVYKHITPNKKIYIGMTTSKKVKERWGKNGCGYRNNKYFWRAIQKYGWDNIEHIIVADNLTKEEACQLEMELIAKYNTMDAKFGYNNSIGGETNAGYKHTEQFKIEKSKSMMGRYVGENSPCYGKTVSEETKQKISNTLKGRKQSVESNEKRRNKLLGHSVSVETREKISQRNKGKKRTSEMCKKLSLSRKGKNLGHIGYWKGKSFSEQHKENIRLSNLGKPKSEEHKRKLSESCRGKKKGPMTEEHKQKIREAWLQKRKLRELENV